MNNNKPGRFRSKPHQKQLILALSMVLTGGASQAATFPVTEPTDDGTGLVPGTLSEAIYLANQNPGADLIELQTDVAITGVMKRLINSDITLTSDAQRRQISGEQNHRPLFIKSGQVVIHDLDIREGKALGGSGSGRGAGMGGAVFVYSGQVTIEQVGFIDNMSQGGTSGGQGGGGMFGDSGGLGGGGLFAGTPSGSQAGGYGGYGHYRNEDPKFGAGGGYSSQNQIRNGGFGGGGGFINEYDVTGGQGGFGGGGGYSYYHNGGDGGFGGGAALGGSPYGGVIGTPGYGGFRRYAAGMGGGVFVRSGALTVTDSVFVNNMALSTSGQNGSSQGLGGALFVLHSTTNSNGNNQGMPTELPTVQGCGLTFTNNLASTSQGTPNNNQDLFDLADRVSPLTGSDLTSQCVGIIPEIELTGNLIEIIDGDDTPEVADGTDFGSRIVGLPPVERSFVVRNTGQKVLRLNGASPVVLADNDSGQFSVVQQPVSLLGAGQAVEFTVQFDPQVSGQAQTRVVIASNDNDEAVFDFLLQADALTSNADIQVATNGVNIEDGDDSPSGADLTDFGPQEISDPPVITEWTITNTGSTDLNLSGMPPVQLSGASAFTVSTQPGITQLSAGTSTTFAISYDPVALGTDTATVMIDSNASNAPAMDFMIQGAGVDQAGIVQLLGNGLVIPQGDRTPRPEDFTMMGYTPATGGSISRTFEINNRGNGQLDLFGVNLFSAGNAISLTNNIGDQTLNADESTFFTLTFEPQSGGFAEPAFVEVFGADFSLLSFFEVSAFGQPTLIVRPVSPYVSEGQDALFTVSADVQLSQSLPYAFSVSGQDVDAADFGGILPAGVAYLPANSSAGQLSIATTADGVYEGQEFFQLRIEATDQQVLIGFPDVTGVVIDDDLIFVSGFNGVDAQVEDGE